MNGILARSSPPPAERDAYEGPGRAGREAKNATSHREAFGPFFTTFSTAKYATPLGGSSEVARYDVLSPFIEYLFLELLKKCCILEKSRKKLAKI